MRKLLLSLLLSLTILLSYAFAEEITREEDVAEEATTETPASEEITTEEFATEVSVSHEEILHVYEFPEIKPTYFLTTGYRLIDVNDSKRAIEFEYPHDSAVFMGEFRALPFPHRIHIEVEYLNKSDYFGDMSYAYKDIVLFRGMSRAVFHNLDNIELVDIGSDATYTIDRTDVSEDYGIASKKKTFFLRLKTPDFPFHVYADGQILNVDGNRQERFLGGSGYYNDIERNTKERDIDWQTSNIITGANTHMGPIEVDISHSEKRFDSGGDDVLYESYSSGSSRAAGTYPYSRIPDSEGSGNALKLHSSYTGQLVVSGTLSNYSRENNYSGAKADYILGSTDLTWMPMTKLTFFLKYRHRENDIDNPDSVTITDLLNSSNTYTYSVKDSISSNKDTLTGNARYRLAKGVTLNAEVSHENIDRENADEWELPETTVKDIAALSLNARIFKNLKIRSKYIYEEIDAPAYNFESDSKNRGIVYLSWTPLPFLFTCVSYDASIGWRDNVLYTIDEEQITGGDREKIDNKIFGLIGISISEKLSFDTSYAHINSKTSQTLTYASNTEYVSDDASYKERANTIGANVNYKPRKNIGLSAGISYTEGRAYYLTSVSEAEDPVSIASFSEVKIRETDYKLSGKYYFKDGWELGAQYSYSDFNNVIENSDDPFEDGDAHVIYLTITKRWE
ncbi:MAG: MtrB/PioB family outer membrane beta-barrel protein [Nitrospirota bacterium]